ncbi:hypothetical protein KFK09_024757 [Dendrobium nobile]|uniref:Uncharacterized protein n=1 Tax=Dendrobium nobile TaxID=94219 RepID=A0A8T3ADH1_DENNO|nr:hypothetical protein KFK09_024757 [Dendrobium nobile]
MAAHKKALIFFFFFSRLRLGWFFYWRLKQLVKDFYKKIALRNSNKAILNGALVRIIEANQNQ